ncbi:MAG: RpiB/LacA/LacB family sugar-phosphate isomerase [Thermotogae bacterium]|nr:MAG: RpiB/LacA/LacB family sugar-phosphate isomerase [Thermotogota bacterium]
MENKKIVIGSDKSGFTLKEALKEYLVEHGFEVEDVGMQTIEDFQPYYEVAPKVAKKVQSGEFSRGLLCCGTGMGMAIVANKFKGVYAAVVEGSYGAKMAKVINNANVLTMGGWKLAPQEAIDMLERWLNASFAEGFPEDRQEFLKNALEKVKEIEMENFK